MVSNKLLELKVEGKYWYFIQPYAKDYQCKYDSLFEVIDKTLDGVDVVCGDEVECNFSATTVIKKIPMGSNLRDVLHECIKTILGNCYEDSTPLDDYDVKSEGLDNVRIYKPVKKKLYSVLVSKPDIGTVVVDKLGASYYRTTEEKPYVITGTRGEQWCVNLGVLNKTYEFMNGTEITEKSIRCLGEDAIEIRVKKDSTVHYAYKLSDMVKNLPVVTSWKETIFANRDGINHDGGDYIICAGYSGKPDTNDMWVVNGEVFNDTYNFISVVRAV